MRLIDGDKLIDIITYSSDLGGVWGQVLRAVKDAFIRLIRTMPNVNPEPQWNLCSETADLPDHEVLCCDLRGNMLIGYLYTDENSDTGFGAEGDGECLVDCVAWREKPEPWYER